MALVLIGDQTLFVDARGTRGPKRSRPDPIVIIERDGQSRLWCPTCQVSLVRRHSETNERVFFGCSKYPDCRFTVDGKIGKRIKREAEIAAGKLACVRVGTVSATLRDAHPRDESRTD